MEQSTSEKFWYFAADGSCGPAKGLEIINVSDWTKYDFDSVRECTGDMRAILARGIRDMKDTYDYDYS